MFPLHFLNICVRIIESATVLHIDRVVLVNLDLYSCNDGNCPQPVKFTLTGRRPKCIEFFFLSANVIVLTWAESADSN